MCQCIHSMDYNVTMRGRWEVEERIFSLGVYITALVKSGDEVCGEKYQCTDFAVKELMFWETVPHFLFQLSSFLLFVSFQKQHGDVPPCQLSPHRGCWHDTTPRHMVKLGLYRFTHPFSNKISQHVENKTTAGNNPNTENKCGRRKGGGL